MTDIQKWRQMIQPQRAKTSASSHESDSHGDAGSQPPTPRRRSRPRLYSYLSGHRLSTPQAKEPEPFTTDYFTNVKLEDNGPEIDPEQAVNAPYSKLIGQPHQSLPLPYNTMIMRVLESYTSLVHDKKRHQERMNEEISRRHAAELQLQEAGRIWAAEQRGYKAEIKRLEVLIARGKKGVAEVMQARVDSIIRRKKRAPSDAAEEERETVYEFIERCRKDEEEIKKTQRFPQRNRPPSPSQRMAQLSRKLARTTVHSDLPFNAASSEDTSRSTAHGDLPPANMSSLQRSHDANDHIVCEKKENRPRSSTDGVSTFSSQGDLLPDEMDGGTADVHMDKDFAAVRSLAEVLARRRGLRVQDVLPELLSFFETKSEPQVARHISTTTGVPDTHSAPCHGTPMSEIPQGNENFAPSSAPSDTAIGLGSGNPPLRRRPPLQVQPSVSGLRRPFSFCPGDDLEWAVGHRRSGSTPTVRSSILDVPLLVSNEELPPQAPEEEMSRPTNDTTPASEAAEEVPSPIDHPVQDHRMPRARRDMSVSSIITALYASPSPTARTRSSSQYSNATTAIRNSADSLASTQHGSNNKPVRVQRSSSSQILLDYKSSLRGSPAAVAAARALGSVSRSTSYELRASGGSINRKAAKEGKMRGGGEIEESDAV